VKSLSKRKLDDARLEENRREHSDAIEELQRVVGRTASVLANITLEDGIDTPIAHRLGRVPSLVVPSAPRGEALTPGVITDVRGPKIDRRAVIMLRADGFGGPIVIDVEVR
jgi:hypothetical protein